MALAKLEILEGGLYCDSFGTQNDEDEEDGYESDEAGGRERDAYNFGENRKKRKRRTRDNYSASASKSGFESDQSRRNGELRLESFFNSLDGCPLTVCS